MQPAIEESGEGRIAEGIRTALGPFMGDAGRITLPGSYRIVIAEG
jgi:hypothetical protein